MPEELDFLEELLGILEELLDIPELLDILEELLDIPEEEDFHTLEEEDFFIPELELLMEDLFTPELELHRDRGKRGLTVTPARVRPRLTRCGLR